MDQQTNNTEDTVLLMAANEYLKRKERKSRPQGSFYKQTKQHNLFFLFDRKFL
jgi:hypothetical protein